MALFSFITDPIKNALTPPGTNAARRDTGRKGYPQKVAGELLSQYEPILKNSLSTLRNNQGSIQSAYSNLFKLANPLHVQGRIDQTRSKLLSDSEAEASVLKARYDGTGAIGLEQGLSIQGRNEANREANDMQTYYNSPEGIAELSNIIIQLQKSFPGADILALLNSIIQGREAPAVGADPLTSIGGLASLFVNPKQKAGATQPSAGTV